MEARLGEKLFFTKLKALNQFDYLLFKKNLKEPEDLFESISQALMNAFDRDAYSGWGGVVYIM